MPLCDYSHKYQKFFCQCAIIIDYALRSALSIFGQRRAVSNYTCEITSTSNFGGEVRVPACKCDREKRSRNAIPGRFDYSRDLAAISRALQIVLDVQNASVYISRALPVSCAPDNSGVIRFPQNCLSGLAPLKLNFY